MQARITAIASPSPRRSATLDVLAEPGTFDRMHHHGQVIRTEIERAAKDYGHDVLTTGLGSVFSVHFGLKSVPRQYADFVAADVKTYTAFRMAMLERGVLLLPEGRWYVGAAHRESDLEVVLPAIRGAMRAIEE